MDLSLNGRHWALRRSRSAPPSSPLEIGPFPHSRLNDNDMLEPDPALLKRFNTAKIIYRAHATIVLYVNQKHILKVLSPLVDVEEIAGIMGLARTVVPVPKVHDYGYSGGCSYILMDCVNGYNLMSLVLKYGSDRISKDTAVLEQVEAVVRRLASVGISHNDLYARNIIVDHNLTFLGVIDWDVAGPWSFSKEYIRRKYFDFDEPAVHEWDYIFRCYCPDVFDSVEAVNERPDYHRNSIQGRRPWSGFWRKSLEGVQTDRNILA